jgi:hypothetical protein
MAGLLAGPLKDAAGLDAVRADLASVVQQSWDPAAFRYGISYCGRDWLTRDRRRRDHRLIVASIVS